LEVVSFSGDFERHGGGLWRRRSYLYWRWREGFFSGNSASYVSDVKKRFGNGAAHDLQRLREGTLVEALLY
jgi:hypothetical protein